MTTPFVMEAERRGDDRLQRLRAGRIRDRLSLAARDAVEIRADLALWAAIARHRALCEARASGRNEEQGSTRAALAP